MRRGAADCRSMSFWSPFTTGFALCATLIVAIGAQNAFVLRQGLRREHVVWIVLFCALLTWEKCCRR